MDTINTHYIECNKYKPKYVGMGIGSPDEVLLQCNHLNPISTKSDLLLMKQNATQKHMHTLLTNTSVTTYILLLPVDHLILVHLVNATLIHVKSRIRSHAYKCNPILVSSILDLRSLYKCCQPITLYGFLLFTFRHHQSLCLIRPSSNLFMFQGKKEEWKKD